jgi:hypothetical protein
MPRKSSMKKAKKSRPSIIHTLRQGDPYGIFDDDSNDYDSETFETDDESITGPQDLTSRTSATGGTGMSTKEDIEEVEEVKLDTVKQNQKTRNNLNAVAALRPKIGSTSKVPVGENTDGKRTKKRSKKSKKHSDGRKRRKSKKSKKSKSKKHSDGRKRRKSKKSKKHSDGRKRRKSLKRK